MFNLLSREEINEMTSGANYFLFGDVVCRVHRGIGVRMAL